MIWEASAVLVVVFSSRGAEWWWRCAKRSSLAAGFNFLERLDDRIRCSHEETVAVVKLERLDDRIRCSHEETVAVVRERL